MMMMMMKKKKASKILAVVALLVAAVNGVVLPTKEDLYREFHCTRIRHSKGQKTI